MRYFVTVALAALALAVVAVHGWGGASAVHEHSEWEQVMPPVMASDFTEDAAAMMAARTWAETCRDNDWVGAPRLSAAEGSLPRRGRHPLRRCGLRRDGGHRRIPGGYRRVHRVPLRSRARTPTTQQIGPPRGGRSHHAAVGGVGDGDGVGGTAAGSSSICPVACLNGVDQGIDCQNMCTFGGERPFVLVCRPGVTYYRIDGGALQWTSGSVAGLRALHGDRFELAEECHGP